MEVTCGALQLGYGKYRQSTAAVGQVHHSKTFNSFEYLEVPLLRGKYVNTKKEEVLCLSR